MSEPLWTGTAHSRWAIPSALVMLVGSIPFFALTPAWWAGIVMIGCGGVVLIFRRITVTIDDTEVVVRYGAPWTWPQRIARRDICCRVW